MEKLITLLIAALISLAPLIAYGQKNEEDIISTSKGDLKITFIGHASLFLLLKAG
jgi:hypothetical protein